MNPATNYETNALNQYSEIGATTVAHDGNGNATDILNNIYGYDAANRLIASNAGAGAATLEYDPAGRLAKSSAGGISTRFQYAGVQLVAEYDDNGAIVARHIPGLGLDNIVASWDLSSTVPVRAWPLVDERGSVIARGGSTAVVSHVNRYDEYGVPAVGNFGRFQYTGQVWLPETGSYHYRARAYLPQVGRFLQPDVLGYSAGTNLYAYVGADPVNFVDPFGLSQDGADPLPPTDVEAPRCHRYNDYCLARIREILTRMREDARFARNQVACAVFVSQIRQNAQAGLQRIVEAAASPEAEPHVRGALEHGFLWSQTGYSVAAGIGAQMVIGTGIEIRDGQIVDTFDFVGDAIQLGVASEVSAGIYFSPLSPLGDALVANISAIVQTGGMAPNGEPGEPHIGIEGLGAGISVQWTTAYEPDCVGMFE